MVETQPLSGKNYFGLNDEHSQFSEPTAIGWALYDSAEFESAARQFERALDQDADNVEALRGLARLRLSENELAGSILLLERALNLLNNTDIVPSSDVERRVRYDLAWALYRLDRFDLAATHFCKLPGYEPIGRKLEAFGSDTPYRMPGDMPAIELPLLAADPLPFISITIAGREHIFVVDTGAGELVLDVTLLDELDLPDFGVRETTFAGGRRTSVTHSILSRLTLDGTAIENIPIEAVDIQSRAPQLSGFIGLNFLMHFRPTMDYAGQQLTLAPKSSIDSPPDETTGVQLRLFDDHVLVAPGAINDRETHVVLASGMAGGAFTCSESTIKQANLDVSEEDAFGGVSVEGGEALVSLHADRVQFGSVERKDVNGFAGGFSPSLEWRYGFRIGGVIAHDFLRPYRWTLDSDKLVAWFERVDE